MTDVSSQLQEVRSFVIREIKNSTHCDPWFWDEHVAIVEKIALELLEELPEANSDVVLLSVWFHDLGRAYGHDKNHDAWGADFAQKYLSENGFDQKIVEQVSLSCRSHRVKDVMPTTTEAKILATADAMSHFAKGFYLRIFYGWGKRGAKYEEMKEKLASKIERDYQDKIFFDFSHQKVEAQYQAWKIILNT